MEEYLYSVLWSILPISELRGGIPYAISQGISPIIAYLICVGANLLAFPIVYFFMNVFHNLFLKWSWYESLFEKLVNRTRKKVESLITKYGFWGLMVFVMIPLPITGAYTGSFAAWIFGIPKSKGILSVSLGVCIAGIIVTLVSVLFAESGLAHLFTKSV